MQNSAGSTGARGYIGVLPLYLTGTSDDEAFFGVAMAEEISLALSRFRVVSVVSPLWLAHLAQNGHDETSMRSVCGIDFLVSGSINRVGDRLRIRLSLFDLRTQHRLVWADRFDPENGNFLSSLDEITMAAVGQIIPHILVVGAERTVVGPLDAATAYDLVLRAVALMKRMDRTLFVEAGLYLVRAIEREPDYSPAYTWYAFWHLFQVAQGWMQDSNAVMRKSGELAASAISLDPGDAFAMTIHAHVSAFLNRRLSVAADLHERALALNPNLAMAWALSAITYSYMGESGEAEKRYNHYQKLGPFDPSRIFFADLSTLIQLSKRDYEAVVAAGRTATQLAPSLHAAYKPYLSALGHLGRAEESELVRARLLSIEPGFSVEGYIKTSRLERETDTQDIAKGLRLAGVPETSQTAP